MTDIGPAALEALRARDTPTICNALEVLDLLTRREAVVLAAARSDDFDIEALKRAMADSAEIH